MYSIYTRILRSRFEFGLLYRLVSESLIVVPHPHVHTPPAMDVSLLRPSRCPQCHKTPAEGALFSRTQASFSSGQCVRCIAAKRRTILAVLDGAQYRRLPQRAILIILRMLFPKNWVEQVLPLLRRGSHIPTGQATPSTGTQLCPLL